MFKMSEGLIRVGSGVLNTDEVAHFVQHSADLRAVIMFHGLIELAEAQGSHNLFLLRRALDGAADLGDFELGHVWFSSG